MTFIPCRYAKRWPDLWSRLPDDTARSRLSNALANGRLEGVEPERGDVELQVSMVLGEISEEQFTARVLELAHRHSTGAAATG